MMNMKKIYFVCFYVLVSQMILSQTTYMTKKGHLKMVAKVNNEPVIAESHKLSVFLDYTTKQMRGTLNLNSLVTENPELEKYFKEVNEPLIIYFSGTIPPDDFMSQPHQPLNFDWEINVAFQDKKFKVILKTTLQHIEEGTLFSCRLNAMGDISTDKFGLNKIILGLDKTIEIQFVQFILRV